MTSSSFGKKASNDKGYRGRLFCLCLVAGCLSAPLNGLSPSLSLVALEFGYNAHHRDVYLGGYISLATMVGQMIGSCVSGYLTDRYSRKIILVTSLLIGSTAMILFGIIRFYSILLVLRVFTGGCQAAIVPVLFSLIGDYYSIDDRATYSAIVSSFLGGGMMIGQLFVGFVLNAVGWRFPFVVMGLFTCIAAFSIYSILDEPQRGSQEDDLADVLSQGGLLPSLSMNTFIESMMIPTVAIMMIQTIPNTVPWGVLSAHFHDFLATDENLSMNQATSLIAMFGAGAAVGGLLGGFIGGKLYAMNRSFLPVFMGVTMSISALLLRELITMDLDARGVSQMAVPVLILSGALAAVNGANIRVVILNLVAPQARGASVAVLNFINCVGRGIGPSLIEIYMRRNPGGRKPAVAWFLNLWLISGTMLCFSCLTIKKDEDRLKLELKRVAQSMALDIISDDKKILK